MGGRFTQIQKLFVNTQFRSMHGNLPTIEVDLPKMLTQEDNDNLVKPIEDCEIKDAVFQMDKFKAPGPDGFGAAFFSGLLVYSSQRCLPSD